MTAPEPTALEMARDWARRVYRIIEQTAEAEQQNPGYGHAQAVINGAGGRQFASAQMASFMALVSIAEDFHRLVAIMTGDVGEARAASWPGDLPNPVPAPADG
jgi:hypothetical protein